ncbi:MAG: leucine-rich repeat domain-containing protein [Breznakibacter sp.]
MKPLFTTNMHKYFIPVLCCTLWVLSIQGLLAQYTLTPDDVEFDPETGTIVSYKWPAQAGTSIIIPDNFNGVPVKTLGPASFYNIKHITDLSSGLTEVAIPGSVIEIQQSAFQYNRIAVLNLTEGIAIIGQEAFRGNDISNLILPTSVDVIGAYAFAGSNISSIVFPENFKEVASGVFSGNNITRLNLPPSLEKIGVDAFSHNHISAIDLPESITYLSGFRENMFAQITIPAHVKEVGTNAFSNNPLTSLTIANGVEKIGNGAFSDVVLDNQTNPSIPHIDLKNLHIPSSVRTIDGQAFRSNYNLASVTFEEGIEYIGNEAFLLCSLTEVVIPSTVKSIGDGAFNTNRISTLALSDGLEEIKHSAFASNKLTQVTIPGTVKILGERAFYNNMQMQHITLEDGVREIGIECFSYNQELQSLTLPRTLVHIRKRAFFNTFFVKVPLPQTLDDAAGNTFSHWVYYDDTPDVYDAAHKVETIGGDVEMSQKGFLALFSNIPTQALPGHTDGLTYTNPVIDGFTINRHASVSVFDARGRFLRSFISAPGQITSLSNLPKGLYLFVIETTGSCTTAKIVKQ